MVIRIKVIKIINFIKDINKENNLLNLVKGEHVGTLVQG